MIKYVFTLSSEIVKQGLDLSSGSMLYNKSGGLNFDSSKQAYYLTDEYLHIFSHNLFIKSTCSYNVSIVIRFPMIKLHSHFWETDHSSVVVIFKSNSNWQKKERLVSKKKIDLHQLKVRYNWIFLQNLTQVTKWRKMLLVYIHPGFLLVWLFSPKLNW